MMRNYRAPAVVAGLEFTAPTKRAHDAIVAEIARRVAPGKRVFGAEAPIANEDGELRSFRAAPR